MNLDDAVELAQQVQYNQKALDERMSKLQSRADVVFSSLRTSVDNINLSAGNSGDETNAQLDTVTTHIEDTIGNLSDELQSLFDAASNKQESLKASLNPNTIQNIANILDEFASNVIDVVKTTPEVIDSSVIGGVFEPTIDAFDEGISELEAELTSAQDELTEQASQWQEQLEDFRDTFEERIENLTLVSVTERWSDANENLSSGIQDGVSQVKKRIVDLSSRVDEVMGDIQTISESLSGARTQVQQGTASLSTSLDSVASILGDVKEILESVT